MASRTRQWLMLAVFWTACFAAAGLGSVATTSSVGTWYASLVKPSWNPPSWVFGPVWTILYIMMGLAAWLVWRARGFAGASGALSIFLIQLLLNAAWPMAFFGIRDPGLAFAIIVILWCAIALNTGAFLRIVPVAGYLFLPYLAWVTFASTINLAIWRLNS